LCQGIQRELQRTVRRVQQDHGTHAVAEAQAVGSGRHRQADFRCEDPQPLGNSGDLRPCALQPVIERRLGMLGHLGGRGGADKAGREALARSRVPVTPDLHGIHLGVSHPGVEELDDGGQFVGDHNHHVDKLGKTAENALESGVDAQIIYGQEYADSVWGNGARAFRVVGSVTPKKGDKVTFSGANTGEVNGIPVIDSAPFCAEIDDIYICGLIRAQGKHHTVCQSGDSGGPVFEITGKKEALAVGIITAEGDSGRLCFYTELSYITNLMHVSVAVHK
jgi:hypothetical protein